MKNHQSISLRIVLVGLFLFGGAYSAHAQTPASPAAVETAVREYFSDIPVMIEIARCESKFRQFTDAGNVLRGGLDGQMVGVFQFFESVHATAATNLGHDLTTLEGNLAYARHLYNQSGTTPWNSARDCWENAATTPVVNTDTPMAAAATDQLTEAQLREKIALLQQLVSLLQTLLVLRLQ